MSELYLTYFLPLLIVWGLVVVLGGLVSYYALRLYRKGKGRSIGLLAFGFTLLSAGSGVSWLGLYLAGMGLFWCSFSSTAFLAVGFASILISLRTAL